MRIAQVVSLLSPDGAYGGPVSVALNISKELRQRGHEVVLFAAQKGYSGPLRELEGVPVKTVPARFLVPRAGFAGLAAPGLSTSIKQAGTFDVLHVHMARDLTTLPIAVAKARSIPTVTQTHGMVAETEHPLAPLVDSMLTRRVWVRSHTNLFLTETERDALLASGASEHKLAYLPNGIRTSRRQSTPAAAREVVFMARLHARKRPMMFLRAAERLLSEGVNATFTIIGADEGEGQQLRDALSVSPYRGSIAFIGPIPHEDVLNRLSRAALYVLPSVNEPFPMSVLEAASLGVPVVVTSSCGVAGRVSRYAAGSVSDESQASLEDAMRRLLNDPERLQAAGRAASRMVAEEFSLTAVGDRLEQIYSRAIADAQLGA